MIDLVTAGDDELAALVGRHGAPAWRATQLRQAAWRPTVTTLDDVREIPAELRAILAGELRFCSVEVPDAAVVADGGATVKLLCRLDDGVTVETVGMETPGDAGRHTRRRTTVCVSTQAGCAVGCPFCATGRLGLTRNLRAAEIVDQVRVAGMALAARGLGPVTHVVYMGMGEPLANVAATIASVRVLAASGISPRRITVSTSGVVPAIPELAAAGLPVTLAVSLHAATDELRDRLVPLNRSYPIDALFEASVAYARATGRRLTLEWCLIGGVNDSLDQAVALHHLARQARAHVNVIPMNRIAGSPWGPPTPERRRAFLAALTGVVTTVRDTRGAEGQAACGQLRASLVDRRQLRTDGTLAPPTRRTG